MAHGVPSSPKELALRNLRLAEEYLLKQDEVLRNMVSQNNLTLSLSRLNGHKTEFERLYDNWKLCKSGVERYADPEYLPIIIGYADSYQKQREDTLTKYNHYLQFRPSALPVSRPDSSDDSEWDPFVTARMSNLSLNPPETHIPQNSTPFIGNMQQQSASIQQPFVSPITSTIPTIPISKSGLSCHTGEETFIYANMHTGEIPYKIPVTSHNPFLINNNFSSQQNNPFLSYANNHIGARSKLASANSASPFNNNPSYQQSNLYNSNVNNHTGENPVNDGSWQPPISSAYNDRSNCHVDFNVSNGGVRSSKLDKIRIIKFYGDKQEWRTYWDLF